jgi:hypothetical protein
MEALARFDPYIQHTGKKAEEVAKKVLLEGFRLPSVKNALVLSCRLCKTAVGQTTGS